MKITVYPGKDKNGIIETYSSITFQSGMIYSIVGPTGAGKTQLLDDLERLSPGDGTTKRVVICDKQPIILHLSQKMHYMVDMKIHAFITLYAESLNIQNPYLYCREIIDCANKLCGEPIGENTKLTRLSGGQSRALMIATVALSKDTDVILLDEIENAGINRLEVLELLTKRDKIVLIITHDPLLALLADYRLILKNGGITRVIMRSEYEKTLVENLHKIDDYLSALRTTIRQGQTLEEDKKNEYALMEQRLFVK